jgi:hypothetical protein
MENAEFEKALEKLKPDIERLTRKVEELPAACLTGFIFSFSPKGLIRFGNIENEGETLVALHKTLSALAAVMAVENPFPDVPYADIRIENKTTVGQQPEEIADALAAQVLITGMEPEHAAACLSLAEKYIQSRRGPQNGK